MDICGCGCTHISGTVEELDYIAKTFKLNNCVMKAINININECNLDTMLDITMEPWKEISKLIELYNCYYRTSGLTFVEFCKNLGCEK